MINEYKQQQAAKILGVYGLEPEFAKSKGFQLGQLDKSGKHVKTADGWKSVKTHGHLVNNSLEGTNDTSTAVPITNVEPKNQEPEQPKVTTKSLINIRNEKNKALTKIEDKLDDHNRGINELEEDELIFLREQRKVLQATLASLDKKIKYHKDEEIVDAPSNQEVVEDEDKEGK